MATGMSAEQMREQSLEMSARLDEEQRQAYLAREAADRQENLILPPIRQAVPEINVRPIDNLSQREMPPAQMMASQPRPSRPREWETPQMYREYPRESQYPIPSYDQGPPGYANPVFAGPYDNDRRPMVPQPSYMSNPYPADYRQAGPPQHEPYHNGLAGANDGKNGPQRKRRGNLPKDTTDKLRDWFHRHLHHPYPTEDEKQALMDQTGLQMNQISNWFINARRRQLPQLLSDAKATDGRTVRAANASRNNMQNGAGLTNGYSNLSNGRDYDNESEEDANSKL